MPQEGEFARLGGKHCGQYTAREFRQGAPMFSTKLRRRFEQAASLAVPLVLVPLMVVPLLAIPIPAAAAMAGPAQAPAAGTAAPGASSSNSKSLTRFCANSDCATTRQTFRRICDFIVKEKATYPTIYIAGYYMRDLVAGYEIFGDRKYLDTAIAYGDYLLKRQLPGGFWATGYGPVYLADTGSALSLFIVLYRHVDPARQKKYFDAVKLYTDSLQKDGMILPSGAFGTGWRKIENGKPADPIYDQYTLSSALTGAIIFTWMYHQTHQDKYRQIAYRALKWVFSTMSSDGNIPYILAEEGGDWAKRGDFKNDKKLWPEMTYGTSGYVSEGVIAFDLYCGNPAWSKWIQKTVRPNISFLLRNQLPNGTWAESSDLRDWNKTRSPGIINYLIWYYDHVDPDPQIQKAIQCFDATVTNPKTGKEYGLLIDGVRNVGNRKHVNPLNTLTGLTGRALADILKPGVDVNW
jgi:hypothetical protein